MAAALPEHPHECYQLSNGQVRAASQIADQQNQIGQAHLGFGKTLGHALPPLRHCLGAHRVNARRPSGRENIPVAVMLVLLSLIHI